jgi:hypothetical protein
MRMHLSGLQAMAAEYSGYAGRFGCCSDLKGILKIAFFLKAWLYKNVYLVINLQDNCTQMARPGDIAGMGHLPAIACIGSKCRRIC